MLVPREKKINLFFRLGLLLIVMVLASSAAKNIVRLDVSAQDRPANRVNIVPGNVEVIPGQESLNWQGDDNAFFGDLGESADLADFNKDNSVYLIDAPAAAAVDASFAAQKENNNPVSSGQAASASAETASGSAQTETASPAEASGADMGIASGTVPADETDGQAVENVLPAPENYAEYALVFKDFNLPENIEINSITNAQLRLSLAGKSDGQNDKLAIYYDLGNGWQESGAIKLYDGASNKTNQGYFLYGLPIFRSWAELGGLKIKISLLATESENEAVNMEAYIDAVWLEIDYAEAEETAVAGDQPPEEPVEVENPEFSLDLVSAQTDFRPEENPDFNFLYKRKKSGLDALLSTILSPFWDEYKNIGVELKVREKNGREMRIENEINYVSDGEFNIRFNRQPRRLKPGKYELEITIADGDKTYTSVKDFSWGVLAVNVNKSIYLPGETADLQMAVLDDSGNTVCDADLFLEITAPDGGVAYLNTGNGLIRRNGECGPNNVIDSPDYNALYGLAGAGAYQLKLTAKTVNGSKSIKDKFEVRESVPFEIERVGPTRIYPWADYRMRLKIKADTDYDGEIRELLPLGFSLVDERVSKNGVTLIKGQDYEFRNRTEIEDSRSLAWDGLSLKQNDYLEITYEFDAPNISPEFYLLGPARIGDFEEIRFWQIASDALVIVAATGGTNVGWTNPANAWDSTNNSYAQRDIPKNGADDSANYLKATTNNATDLGGTITKVEIGVEGYVQRTETSVYLAPVLNGAATGSAQQILGTTLGTTADVDTTYYVDVTSATSSWTWTNIINLDVLAYGNNTFNANKTLFIDQLRIRVTYNEPNSAPTGSFNSVAQKNDGSGTVDVSFNAADANVIDNVRAKLEYVAGGDCNFSSSSDPSIDTTDANTTAVFGDPKVDNNFPYQIGTTTGWIFTASGTNTVNFDWLGKTDLPSADGVYCLRLTVNDFTVDGTSTTATTTLDNVAPTAPGAFALATTSIGNEVRLAFGASSTDSNFQEYKVFYKPGTSGVTEADSEFNQTYDSNLAFSDYNGATSTLIGDLLPRTEYVFKIFAYDQYGNKASSTEQTITTGRAKPVRGNSVSFLAGQYSSSDGITGQQSDTNQSFPVFDFSLAETAAKIENAYVIFEADFESYINNAGNYTGHRLAFDACEKPCTANAFSGSGAVSVTDSTVLAYDETASNMVRLLLDVTNEATLASYSGGAVGLAGQVGYRIDRGTATNSISAAKAVLAVTYKYYNQETTSYTNTVVYPLESTVVGDSGSRLAVQNDDCTVDVDCPKFNYNMNLPEFSGRLSQWFQTYDAVDGNDVYDANINVNIEGTNIDSATYIHESALGGTQGNAPAVYFSPVTGFAENTAQQLEYHAASPGAIFTYYLIGGEVVETYTASTSAAVKTRTVSLPLGVINNGATTTKTNASVNVYFPENGIASGTVSIKKAWLRIISNNYNTSARTMTVSTKTGNRAETGGYVYNYNPSAIVAKPSFNIIHVIPSADYMELESANASGSKAVTVYTQNSNATDQGGTSAELLVTYTYTSESIGHLASFNIYSGQSNTNGNSQLATTSGLRLVLPEPPGTKTMLAGGLLASYLMSASNGTMPGANLILDANLATGTPVCVNAYNSRPDSVNAFTEFYKNVFSALTTNNRQAFSACFSNNGGSATSTGAKMNSSLIYTYKWEAPAAQLRQDNWRWYENLDALNPIAPKANEKIVVGNMNIADILRLRLNVGLTAEDLPVFAQDFRLQFGAGADCSAIASSSWFDVGTTSSAVIWRGFNNPSVADGSSTGSTTLSTSNFFQTYEEDNPSGFNPRALAEGEYGEWDWVIYNNGASSTADYCFRMVKADGGLLNNYASWPQLITAASNTPPAIADTLIQTYANGTTSIANQTWINQTEVRLSASTTDVNINEVVGLYFELIDNGGSFRTATSVPTGACAFGADFTGCASKVWLAESTSGDYRILPFIGTTSITALPQNYDGYKWQVLSCDDGGACSAWTSFGANPNFRVDLTPPSPPGSLTVAGRTPTSLNVVFGATTTEANFLEYKIFYKKATSSVKETDSPWVDGNLSNINFNGATSTLVNTLSAGSTYVFNIWAYDLAGNKASSTVELVASTTSSFTPPSGIISTISQRMDGTGAIALDITASDPDNDDTLRARFEYEAGATCAFASSSDPTLDPADAKTTALHGDPKVDNDSVYQLGTTTGWIWTSLGANHVYFDWLSGADIPNANTTYCVRMTLNDGLQDQATSSTKLILVDNLAPVVPGPLTLISKNATSTTLKFGTSSSDTHFDRYRIFYATGSPVTIADFEQSDANLSDVLYNYASTTKINGLMPNTQYYFNIWAYDDYGNYSSSTELAVKTNGLPFNATSTGQFKINETTVITNGAWTTESEVRLRASANDPDSSEILTLYFQFIPNASSFASATSQPSGACAWGTAYNSCTSKIWFVSTGTPGDYTSSPFIATTSITGIPDSATGYKWQAIACDDEADCSAWAKFNLTIPNIKVDTTPPTPPGALTLSSKTSTNVVLAFGSSTSEANFSTYRIFYATSSPVSASSSEHTDSHLGSINYGGASLTTIADLLPNTQYYFNIFAYDQIGQVASSTEMAVTTNPVQSTPGVIFYTRNTRVLYYKIWDGTAWGQEQSGPTLGSAAGDNIRQLASTRSDDGGKVAVLVKTWDGANQEWWGTVYKVAANSFATSTQLGAANASAVSANLISGCLGSLSGGEFFAVRNNNAANGTLVYSWDNSIGWTAEPAGPNPVAVVNGCRLVRRPGTDNYLLTTFDNNADIGSAYYYGGATYANSWTVWTEHSTNEYNIQNFVGDAFFDPSDNTRGALNYSNSLTNAYTYGKRFIADDSSISYGAASTTPQAAPDNWANTYVQGEFSPDPGSAGIAYFAGRDINQELNVYKIDISGGTLAWGTAANGDNISSSTLYSYANYAQKPFTIAFYKNTKGLVLWNLNASSSPRYSKLDVVANSLDSASSTVPGPASSVIWPRVRSYNDPNEDELLAVYQNNLVDYGAVFWSGAGNQFFSSGNQAWTLLATSTGATNVNDDKFTFAFSGRNSAPNTPTALTQLKNDASTTIANGAWTTENSVYLKASATDPDTSEVITLYVELVANASSTTASTSQPVGACVWGTAYNSCASKIWFVASSSPGDYSTTAFTNSVSITGLPESSAGYKWQVIACDDSAACSNWVKYNLTQPNFKVDTAAPTAPGNLTISSKTSTTVTLAFGATTTEANFLEYRIYYKQAASGVTEADTRWNDANLGFINYNGAANTTVNNLASSTQYVFRIWAYDQAGNKATSSAEVATTTNASAYLTQTSYLLENDDGANVNSNTAEVTASTSLTNVNIGERINARIQVDNTGGDIQANTIYKLQYENQTDAPGTWTDVGVATEISYSLGLSGTNGDSVTSAKASSNPRIWANGSWHEGVNLTGSYSLANGYYTEFVFAVKTQAALAGRTYRLRLYNSTDNRLLNQYNNYPIISIISSETKRYSKAAVASLPTTTSDLTYYFDPEGYADVSADENANRDDLASAASFPVVNFFEKTSTNTQAITASWNGQSTVAATSAAFYLQVYRFGATNAWVTVASNTSASANTDFTLSGNINAKLSEYYNGSYWTYWRVYQASGSETLRSDYFNISYSAPVAVVSQNHYRWRTDDGSQTTANWLEAEDIGSPTASTSLIKEMNIRLRLTAANTGGGAAANYAYRLEYASTTANCATDPGGWVAVPTDGTQHFRMATTTNFGNGSSTTAQLSGDGNTFIAGQTIKDPSNTTGPTTLAESQYTENEYVFYATTNAGDGKTYCFRATNAGTALNSYSRYAELTLAGNPNTVPNFTVNPSDNGSATNSPTNFGSNVAFTATADDPEADNYYLAVCKTNGITAGNDGPPTCDGGSWCISSMASSTVEATCNYAAATSSEVLSWYGFVCDHRAGVGVAKCSLGSQGGSGNDNDSPFNINHRPVFAGISTQNNNQDPGTTFNIISTSSDADVVGGADSLYFYVCRTNSASFSGCTFGAGDTVCQVVGTTSPNVGCSYADTAPTPAGAYPYYGFLFDNHSFAASTSPLSASYSINNVVPLLGFQALNSGNQIVLNIKGAPDKLVQTINTSVEDQNGCATGLVSATAVIYMSNATSGPSCAANDNDCYQINTSNCIKSDCTDDTDALATYTCSADFKYFADPTDTDSGWAQYNWLSRLQVFDGFNYAASTSASVELKTTQALDVLEPLIDFGSNMYVGDDTGTTNQPTTIVNIGNSPLDTDLSGTDMTGNPSGTITVNNLEWSQVSGFNWSSGTDLTSGGQIVDTTLPKPASTSDIIDYIYWGIGIPLAADPSEYTGQNIFTATVDPDNW